MSRPPHQARVKYGRISFVKQGTSGFDLRDPYSFAIGLSWGGFALLFAALELVINACFGMLYMIQPGAVANMPDGSFFHAFFFSVETLATVGYGVMAPVTLYGHIVSGVEIISGTAFTAIMTGLTFVRFSRPRARIIYADTVVINVHNNVPTLMVRLANARSGLMTDAAARLTVLLPETTLEGRTFRRTYDLQLLRPHSPLFAITWVLMHPINEESPLHGMALERLREAGARLFLTVQAWDVQLATDVRDLRDYSMHEIRPGMRFADVVTFDENGIPVADFARISELEVDPAWSVS